MKTKNRIWRGMILASSMLGGAAVFQLGGCDPTVKQTVFDGVQTATTSLVSSFISALFLAITPAQDSGVTTVKAVIEHATSFFC